MHCGASWSTFIFWNSVSLFSFRPTFIQASMMVLGWTWRSYQCSTTVIVAMAAEIEPNLPYHYGSTHTGTTLTCIDITKQIRDLSFLDHQFVPNYNLNSRVQPVHLSCRPARTVSYKGVQKNWSTPTSRANSHFFCFTTKVATLAGFRRICSALRRRRSSLFFYYHLFRFLFSSPPRLFFVAYARLTHVRDKPRESVFLGLLCCLKITLLPF